MRIFFSLLVSAVWGQPLSTTMGSPTAYLHLKVPKKFWKSPQLLFVGIFYLLLIYVLLILLISVCWFFFFFEKMSRKPPRVYHLPQSLCATFSIWNWWGQNLLCERNISRAVYLSDSSHFCLFHLIISSQLIFWRLDTALLNVFYTMSSYN